MKKFFSLFFTFIFIVLFVAPPAYAAIGDLGGVGVGVGIGGAATLPQEGSWITDNEVTKIGKNAVRSGNLLDWTLQDYQWASSLAQQYSTSSLVSFWLTIQRIVYALFLFVVLVTAFMLIITRGRSLSAKRFLPRFFMVVLLVTFSFSLVQFLYQIVDIFQGFFLKNPQGQIISSKDLLYIGFDYKNFQGIRVFGASYDESALMSLLLVKLTAFTYYVMAILLIFRKIILWFLIIISPVFPLLLLFYPLRNTAKIWVGEFFRWLLYAPLFAIFLSGLVKLWQSPFGLPLLFNFNEAGVNETYPTAVNILLGGPGQKVFLHNSLNLPDTFALYLVALLMLWVVIILPFILLQIFLDNLMAFNYRDNPLMRQMYTFMNTRAGLPPKPPILPAGPLAPAGLARTVPFGRRMQIPSSANLAKNIPISASQMQSIPRSVSQAMNKKMEVMNLTNLSIPSMRDIARFETAKLSKDTRFQQQVFRTKETLVQVANPESSSSSVERDRFKQIREKLVTQVGQGNQVASTVLNAATTYNNYKNASVTTSTTGSLTNLIKNIAAPALVVSKRESEKISQIREQLTKEAASGNKFAQNVLSSVNEVTNNQITQIQSLLRSLSNPEKVSDTKERQAYTSLREKIVEASKSGNTVATLLSSSLEKSTSQEQVKIIQDQLIQAAARGEPLATEILHKTTSQSATTEKDTATLQATLEAAARDGNPLATTLLQMLISEKKSVQTAPVDAKTKLKTGAFPVVNRIQQVSLDDYEAVKKMWKENYKNLSVPEAPSQLSRKQWVTNDISDIQETISLLSSANPQDIEEGMRHVSDILPFLLIGGFSQTEIIAYLKAKMEAGKAMLEDGAINEEEDMLLSAKRSADIALGHLSASVEAVADSQESAGTFMPESASVTVIRPIKQIISEESEKIAVSTRLNSLLASVKLPRITLQDVVKFETACSTAQEREREQVRTVLTKISSVDSLSTEQERSQYRLLQEELVTESKKGNALATHILLASEQVGELSSDLKQSESNILLKTMQNIVSPEGISGPLKVLYVQANQKLLASREKADLLAGSMLGMVQKIQESDVIQLSEFLEKISNPTSLSTASEQMHYSKFVERIAQASEDKNVTASSILKTAREGTTKEKVAGLVTTISSEALKGDQLAAYITQSVFSSHSADTAQDVGKLYKQLQQEKIRGNTLASTILALFVKQKRADAISSVQPLGLPKQNRLSQVSLEDYETVKKMWTESYSSSDLDKSQTMTREQWIAQDMQVITKSINLLSSTNPEQQQEGMEQVGEILPFLLLGGFSQNEVVGYLKAKLEAGKVVLENLGKDDLPDLSTSARVTRVQSLEKVQSLVLPTGSSSLQQTFASDDYERGSLLTQLGLQPPTLQEIVAYEAGKTAKQDMAASQKIGTTLKALLGSVQPLSSQDRQRSAEIRDVLKSQAQIGNAAAQAILAVAGVDRDEEISTDDPGQFLMTLRAILDPSTLSNQADQAAYRHAREQLMIERQKEEGVAVTVMKLIDKASHQESESVVKLLSQIDNPLQIVEDKQRETYSKLKDVLEKEKGSSIVASAILAASHKDITPVSANKIRVLLFESAMHADPLATQILKEYVVVPQTTLNEASALYQQFIAKPDTDLFAKLLVAILNNRSKKSIRHPADYPLRLPNQNRLQQVSIDDYEAVKRMLCDMYLHSDVPQDANGKDQVREGWIGSEKKMAEQALSLLSSDDPENIDKGMEIVKDVLPFLLLGGFSQNEVLEYLKAKIAAASQAIQILLEGRETEMVTASAKTVSSQQVMTVAREDDAHKE